MISGVETLPKLDSLKSTTCYCSNVTVSAPFFVIPNMVLIVTFDLKNTWFLGICSAAQSNWKKERYNCSRQYWKSSFLRLQSIRIWFIVNQCGFKPIFCKNQWQWWVLVQSKNNCKNVVTIVKMFKIHYREQVIDDHRSHCRIRNA